MKTKFNIITLLVVLLFLVVSCSKKEVNITPQTTLRNEKVSQNDLIPSGSPKTDFTITNVGTDGLTFKFNNTSVKPVDYEGLVEYKWTFGDGSTSNEKSPTHTYSMYGDRNVTLMQILVDEGILLKKTKTIFSDVKLDFEINFWWIDQHYPGYARMYDLKPVISLPSYLSGSGVDYKWVSSAGANYSSGYLRIYNPGTHTVTLTATIQTTGKSIAITKNITTQDNPEADFTIEHLQDIYNISGPNPFYVKIKPLLYPDSWYDIGFGDGEYSEYNAPVVIKSSTFEFYHFYRKGGDYYINLQIVNKGVKFVLSKTINIPYTLTAYFKFNGPFPARSLPTTMEFYNYATNADKCIWDLGDGSPLIENNKEFFEHKFPSKGTYTVTLTAYKGTETKTFTKTVEVK